MGKTEHDLFLDRPKIYMRGESFKETVTEPEMTCGIASCRPKGFNYCSNLAGFTFLYGMTVLMTSTCSAYMGSQLTTLEKYFGFSSSQSGFLLSCNDLGFLMTTLIFSHFARKVHIPRVLGVSTMFFGMAAFICSLAYFGSITKQNRPDFLIKSVKNDMLETDTSNVNNSTFPRFSQQLCDINRNGTGNISDTCADELPIGSGKIGVPTDFTKVAFSIMVIGLILQGIGKSPRGPYASTYIDDNGEKSKTAMYLGITYSMAILGPAIAFGLGGLFTRIYVTLEAVPISPYDPRWVGAWWVGFVLFGSLALLTGIPMLCFPRRLKPRDAWKPRKPSVNVKENMKDFLRDIWKLVRNPVYFIMVSSGCLDILAISGFISFTPKYMESQFALPVWQANIIMGMLGILAAGIGTVVGGFTVTKFKFSPLTCLKCVMASKIIFTITISSDYYIGCNNPSIVGYNSPLNDNSSCIENCQCDVLDYFPVCGSDGRNYFSPCEAGCSGMDKLLFTNCTCVATYDLSSNSTATPGLCPSGCNMVYAFATMTFIGSFVGTFSIMPGFIFIMRSVTDKQKSLAIGLASFLHSIFGWLPGPVIFGMIVDSSCRVWSSRCKGQGACAMYDIEDFRIKRATFEIVCDVVVFGFMCLIFALARKKTDWSTGEQSTDRVTRPETEVMMKNGQNKFDYNNPRIDRIYNGPVQLKTFRNSSRR